MAVPWDELRRYMLVAYDLDMTGGDYVFLDVDNLFEAQWSYSNETWATGQKDGRDQEARDAMEALFFVSIGLANYYMTGVTVHYKLCLLFYQCCR